MAKARCARAGDEFIFINSNGSAGNGLEAYCNDCAKDDIRAPNWLIDKNGTDAPQRRAQDPHTNARAIWRPEFVAG